jgi:hypothetical protein
MALNFYGSTPSTPASRQPGSTMTGGKVAQLTTSQLNDPQWGFGTSFQGAARQAGTEALQGSMSGQDPANAAAQAQMRDYYTGALGGLGKLGDLRGSNLDTQMQGGLSNLLQNYKSQAAGTGRIGSSQYGRGQGDIASRIAGEYTKGLSDLSGQQLQNAGMIGGGLNQINASDLAERGFQNKQANDYANYLSQQQGIDAGRESGLAQIKQQQDAANNAFWGQVVQAGAMVGGTMLAGPAGGMAAGQLAGGMSGGGGGSGMSGQTSSGGSTGYQYPTVGQSYGYR